MVPPPPAGRLYLGGPDEARYCSWLAAAAAACIPAVSMEI